MNDLLQALVDALTANPAATTLALTPLAIALGIVLGMIPTSGSSYGVEAGAAAVEGGLLGPRPEATPTPSSGYARHARLDTGPILFDDTADLVRPYVAAVPVLTSSGVGVVNGTVRRVGSCSCYVCGGRGCIWCRED